MYLTPMKARKRWHLPAVGGALLLLTAGQQGFIRADAVPAPQQTLQLVPDKVDFGSVVVGTRSDPKTITLTSKTNSTVVIGSILVSGIDFAQNNNCGTQLAAGAQCSIQVTFQPAISGPRIGTLIITNANDPASPHLLVLNGTGQDPR
jgi:hypothetical protein